MKKRRREGHEQVSCAPTLAVLVGLCCLGVSGAASAQQPAEAVAVDSGLLATHRSGELTYAEYDSWLRYRGLEPLPWIRRAEARQLILTQVLADAALDRGLEKDESFEAHDELVRDLRLTEALRADLAASIEISPADVEAARQAQPDAFQQPRRLRLRMLLLRWPKGDAGHETTWSEMARIQRELDAGTPFAELARHESDAPSRSDGGLIGVVESSSLPGPLAAAAHGLEAGQVSKVVETEQGLVLLWCDKVFAQRRPDSDEVTARLQRNLRHLRANEEWQQLAANLWQQADPRIDLSAIESGRDGAAVLILDGERLSVGKLRQLLRHTAPGRRVDRRDLEEFLKEYARYRLAARHANELGLERRGDVAELLRWQRRETLAYHELLARLGSNFETPDVEQVESHYYAHVDRFRQPDEWRLSIVQLPADDRDRAQAALEQLRRTVSFRQIAREHSVHSTSSLGGTLGWQREADVLALDPEILPALRQIKTGEVTPLVRGTVAWWLVKIDDFRAGRAMSLDEARPQARADLEDQLLEDRLGGLRKQLSQELGLRFSQGVEVGD